MSKLDKIFGRKFFFFAHSFLWNLRRVYEKEIFIYLCVENAMEKYEILGGKNLNIISIKEDYSYSSNYLYRSICDGADNLNNFENQKIEVNAKVIVEFA